MEYANAKLMTGALLTVVACSLGTVVLKTLKRRGWKQKIQKTRDKREKDFKQAEQEVQLYRKEHAAADANGILALSLKELQEKLQQGSLSPKEVFFAYMEKTLDLQPKLNCCTEILLESFDQVKTLDSHTRRPLYGVPVSIKDNVGVKGYDSTCGLLINLDDPVENDCVLVEVLKKQGAIPFVKTNVPQTLLSFDSSNPIFGTTVNPHNNLKSPGGSSGGEASLIGGGGSLIGLGTDVGGSIRVPASFCGICGLKPTAGRLSSQGVRAILAGQKSVKSTVGPMARDVDSLALFMDALLCDDMFFLDPTVPPLPFNMQIYKSSTPLRIGYIINDGLTQPSPGMARAIRETKALLEKAGHALVPYHPLNMEEFMCELDNGALADGLATLFENLKDGPVDPILADLFSLIRLPNWLRKLKAFLMRPLCFRAAKRVKSACGVGSVYNVWKNHFFIEEYTAKTIAHWRKCNIDVLLCPSLGPACQLNQSSKIPQSLSLTMMYNGLNFPAGVVPVSTVTAEDEAELKLYKGNYEDVFDKSFKKVLRGGEGLPLAVQCVALPWQEELCLRLMKEVERLVRES